MKLQDLIDTINEDPSQVREALELIKRQIPAYPEATEAADADFIPLTKAGGGTEKLPLPILDQRSVTPLSDVTALSSLNTAALVDGQQFSVGGFWPGAGVGGGLFSWDPEHPKTEHNGGTVIDPDRISELDTVNKTFGAYFTPAGSGAGCFVAMGAKESVSVQQFGAVPGQPDSAPAFRAAAESIRLLPGPKTFYIPAGEYRHSAETNTGMRLSDQTSVFGDGHNSVIVFDDRPEVGTAGTSCFQLPNQYDYLEFRDFAIRGTAREYMTQDNAKAFFRTADSSGVHDLKDRHRILMSGLYLHGCRTYCTLLGYVQDFVFCNNTMEYCLRDGVRATHATRSRIYGNSFKAVADDAVALHTRPEIGTEFLQGQQHIITGNTFDLCQGVKINGARIVDISHNIFKRSLRSPIAVRSPSPSSGGVEGRVNPFAIKITHNLILDSFSMFGTLDVIDVRCDPRTDSTGATEPPFPYNYVNPFDDAVAGGYALDVSDNIITRSLPSVANFSDYGDGAGFGREGEAGYDGSVDDSSFHQHAIRIRGPWLNFRVSRNSISHLGVGTVADAIRFDPPQGTGLVLSGTVSDNQFYNCGQSLLSIRNSGSGECCIDIAHNDFNLDPYRTSVNRNPDGTWTSASNFPAIDIREEGHPITVSNNKFRNCSRLGFTALEGAGLAINSGGNIVFADFVSESSSANRGVWRVGDGSEVLCVKIDGDPQSPGFESVVSVPQTSAPDAPTSGFYMRSHYVSAVRAAISSGGITLGWVRLTTGDSHVIGTDWAEVKANAS